MRNVPGVRAALGLIGALIAAPVAGAEAEGPPPPVSGEVTVEIQNDRAYRSDDKANEFNTLFTKTELSLTSRFSDAVSLFTGFVFEPVQSPPAAGRNRFFDDQGLYVEVLRLDYETERFGVFGGKFTPRFGIAWDAAPGIYGTDFAEDYELAERIGFGGVLKFGDESLGRHELSASTFFRDTSGLAGSVLTRRQKTREADGGPGNTGSFSSFAVGLDGSEYRHAPGFRYHVAVARQGKGRGNDKHERGLVAGAEYEIEMTETITVTPLVEYADFRNADATDGQDRAFWTAGLRFGYGSWNLALAGARRNTDAADDVKTRDKQFQVSAGYAFASGISLDVGWMTNRVSDVDTETVGALLAYTYEF